jgi:hypothetical protein
LTTTPKVRGGARAGAGRPKLPDDQRKVYVPTGKPKGRPALPPEQRKTQAYVPTGNPKGRPKQKELSMPEVIAQMRAMQAEIQALRDQLNRGNGTTDNDTEPQLAEMNESLQLLRKQYMRFL